MELLKDYTFLVVIGGVTLLGAVCGVIGSFAVLRKQSLLGDGIAHSSLVGVVLAFIFTGSKNTEVLLFGGLVAGIISVLLIYAITKHTKIKFDSALALVMTVFFGFGLVLLTYVQKLNTTNQAGLERFIYGQASTMLLRDVKVIAFGCVFLLAFVFAFWKEFKLLCFDFEFAKTLGYNLVDFLLTILFVVAIMIGLQTVGVVLISAMMIAPAVASRQWVNSLFSMVVLSAVFGSISSIIGTILSAYFTKLPTGPVIVIVSTIFAVSSIVLSSCFNRS